MKNDNTMKNENTTQMLAEVHANNKLASVLDYSRLKNAALIGEVKKLDKWTASAIQNEKDKAGFQAEQACILDKIKRTEVYKKDGFANITDFAEAIGLFETGTVSKSQLSQLCAAGRIYNDKDAPVSLKRTAPFALSGAQGSINDDEKRKELYKRAEPFVKGLTQAECRQLNSDIAVDLGASTSGKPVKVYHGMLNGKLINDNPAAPCKPDDWVAYATARDYEVIAIKAQGEFRRYVLIKGKTASLLMLGESINNKAENAKKNNEYRSKKHAETRRNAEAKKAEAKAKAKVKATAEAVEAKAKTEVEAV